MKQARTETGAPQARYPSCEDPTEPVDRRSRARVASGHGGFAIPPRGDMPKYRVPFSRGRSHVILHHDISRQAFRLIGTANAPVLIDVRTDADFAADPRLIPGAIRRSHRRRRRLDRRFLRQLRHRCLPARRQARARHRGLAAARRRHGRNARRRLRGLEGGQTSAAGHVKTAAARRQGPHRVGDARAAESRPHRLPLADPPLCRSECGVPVVAPSEVDRRRRAVQRHAL